jgi:hypothetical protein
VLEEGEQAVVDAVVDLVRMVEFISPPPPPPSSHDEPPLMMVPEPCSSEVVICIQKSPTKVVTEF